MSIAFGPDPIVSLAEFVSIVTRIRDEWESEHGSAIWLPWFRGQAKATEWKLQPTIYRRPLTGGDASPMAVEELEADLRLRIEFERRGGQVTNEGPRDRWEWYFLMQHYAAPTRLLDWTDGALIALYFSVQPHVESNAFDGYDAAVWVLDPVRLNKHSLGSPERPEVPVLSPARSRRVQAYLPTYMKQAMKVPRYPVSLDPPHVSRRFAVQRSRFVLFGTDTNGIEECMKGDERLVKLLIASKACRKLYRDLQTCGISRSTLFPDLEGLGRELALSRGEATL